MNSLTNWKVLLFKSLSSGVPYPVRFKRTVVPFGLSLLHISGIRGLSLSGPIVGKDESLLVTLEDVQGNL